jgi:hypothetical protein
MPVSDPKKILKTRGFLKPTTAIYHLKYRQPKTKSSFEPSTSHSSHPETINPTLLLSEVKSEIHLTTSGVHKGKNPKVNLSEINIPLTLQLDFMTSPSLEEYTIYSDSTPAGSLNYISCESEGPSPHIPFHPSSVFLSLKEAKDSLLVFQNPLYNTQFSYPIVPMVAAGGGGGGFLGGGGGGALGGGGGAPEGGVGGQRPPLPPRVFAKVDARYVPLFLPVPLHDLPKNYIKILPKFTGEGDLTIAEHINFFNQFTYILGLEHKDLYSRLFVYTFEGQV